MSGRNSGVEHGDSICDWVGVLETVPGARRAGAGNVGCAGSTLQLHRAILREEYGMVRSRLRSGMERITRVGDGWGRHRAHADCVRIRFLLANRAKTDGGGSGVGVLLAKCRDAGGDHRSVGPLLCDSWFPGRSCRGSDCAATNVWTRGDPRCRACAAKCHDQSAKPVAGVRGQLHPALRITVAGNLLRERDAVFGAASGTSYHVCSAAVVTAPPRLAAGRYACSV